MRALMVNTSIRIDGATRDKLERFKLRLAGAVIRNMTQAEVIGVLLVLGDKYFPDAVEIAGEDK